MEEASEELLDLIILEVAKLPDTQINDEVRNKLKQCKENNTQKYNCIVEISKMDLSKVSSFVKELCALDKHYIKPTQN